MGVEATEDIFIYVRQGTVMALIDGMDRHLLHQGDAVDIGQASKVEITAQASSRLIVCRGDHRVIR